MSDRDEVQAVVDRFCKDSGFNKKSGSWYRRQDESIAVINLQRSQHSRAYYLNVALWLLALGEAEAPKEHTCHVRTRLARLVSDAEALNKALDLEQCDGDRSAVVLDALSIADALLRACNSLDGCRQPPGRQLIDRAVIRRPAQVLLG